MKNKDFISGKVPITKEEVRAISLNKLELLNAKTFIDVGAGTGSVSIEAGYSYPNLKVIAIERNDDAIDLVKQNKEKFNLDNVEIIKAYAPVELDKDINKKIAENEEFVRYTFFELKVRHNLSEDEIDEVLRLARNKFENLGYRVYFTGAKYNYQGENRIVESNEYLVAIKGL